MRILVVTPWVPTTRRPRSRQFISMLSARHHVRVLAAAWSAEEAAEAEEVPAPTEVVRLGTAGALARVAAAMLSARSLQQAYVDARRLRRRMAQLEAEFDPDVVLFNVVRSAGLVGSLRNARSTRILDLDEFRSAYYAQVRELSRSRPRRLVAAFESRRMERAEREAIESFSACLVSSPKDLRPEDPRIRLVRSAHLLAPSDGLGEAREAQRIVFVGRMSYSANEEAVLWFAREVWPAVAARYPDATLHIVGEAPSGKVMALADERVRVLGRVASVDEYYRQSAVMVVPVTMATGVQMKLIEGLATGTPTIVTPLVADLAGVEHGRECLVASGPEEWLDAIGRVFDEPESARAMAARGHAWLERHHSPAAVGEQLDQVLRQAVPT